MIIQYNKNKVIAAARFILENKPSSKIPSEIPHANRGYLPERGQVDEILRNIRHLAKEDKEVFEDVQQKLAAGDTIHFVIAVSPWFGDALNVQEEI